MPYSEGIDASSDVTPFSERERQQLASFVRRSRRAFDRLCSPHPDFGFTVTGGPDQPLVIQEHGVDEDALALALLDVRVLWMQKERASFDRVQALVKRLAHQSRSPDGRELIRVVKEYAASIRDIEDRSPGLTLRAGPTEDLSAVVKPRRVFEDFLNGIYFHEDEERLARIGTGPVAQLQRHLFVSMARDLTQMYAAFSNIVEWLLEDGPQSVSG